jgi:hypothetical protein
VGYLIKTLGLKYDLRLRRKCNKRINGVKEYKHDGEGEAPLKINYCTSFHVNIMI